MPVFDFAKHALAMIGLLLSILGVPSGASAQTAQDHRGNRIENFRQSGIVVGGRDNRTLACTQDRSWCAELTRAAPEGRLSLVIAPSDGLSGHSRTYIYVLPPGLVGDGGVTIWDRIIIEANGAVMVGLDLSKETRREGFRSYQRRLVLLRVGPGPEDLATPVLEAPLSGSVVMDACSASEAQADHPGACTDRFRLSTLFTVVPQLDPDERVALIMVAEAVTSPGRRVRSGGLRAPIERTEDDEVTDPVCTFTRTFYFDDARRRYLPDAPLPECPDFLEP